MERTRVVGRSAQVPVPPPQLTSRLELSREEKQELRLLKHEAFQRLQQNARWMNELLESTPRHSTLDGGDSLNSGDSSTLSDSKEQPTQEEDQNQEKLEPTQPQDLEDPEPSKSTEPPHEDHPLVFCQGEMLSLKSIRARIGELQQANTAMTAKTTQLQQQLQHEATQFHSLVQQIASAKDARALAACRQTIAETHGVNFRPCSKYIQL